MVRNITSALWIGALIFAIYMLTASNAEEQLRNECMSNDDNLAVSGGDPQLMFNICGISWE